MALTGKVKSFTRFERLSRVKADVGGGDIRTPTHYSAPGDDSQPLPSDYVVMVRVPGTGKYVAVGYLDPNDEQKAGAGEKRIYSRAADGSAVAGVYLKDNGNVVVTAGVNGSAPAALTLSANGSIKGQNNNGFFELAANGDFIVNGIVFDIHSHPQANDGGGNVEQPVGLPF